MGYGSIGTCAGAVHRHPNLTILLDCQYFACILRCDSARGFPFVGYLKIGLIGNFTAKATSPGSIAIRLFLSIVR